MLHMHAYSDWAFVGTPLMVLVKFAFMTKHQFQLPLMGFGHLSTDIIAYYSLAWAVARARENP